MPLSILGRYACSLCATMAMLTACSGSSSADGVVPGVSAVHNATSGRQTFSIAMLAACSGSNSTNGVVPLAPVQRASALRNATSGSHTFYYTGAEQSFKVPSGVTSITVVADGAAGAAYTSKKVARGGRTQATVPVTPHATLYVFVGGEGSYGSGGFNGGGGVPSSGGYGGGGASDVREGGDSLGDRVLVAGAGGGGGDPNQHGGAGGGTTGKKGSGPTNGTRGGGGGGGTQSQGGSGGTAGITGGNPGGAGALGVGGTGGQNGAYASRSSGDGGGGGGGYYGGGGGGGGGYESCGPAFPGGGAGGGSSYVESSATGVTMSQGWKSDTGNGQVAFSWK